MRLQDETENLGDTSSHQETPSTHKENKRKTDRKIQETMNKWATKDQNENEEVYLGDEMIPVKKDILRYTFQNINGIKLEREQPAWNHMMELVKEQEIGIFGFAETNVEWKPATHNQCAQIMKRVLRH
jgi:hypothetical protein